MLKPKTLFIRKDIKPFNGNVNLGLAGFAQQQWFTTDDILALINRIPNAHLQGLREIVYDPQRIYHDFIDDSLRQALKHSKGMFLQHSRKVLIHDIDSAAMFAHILYHEIGHYVFYVIIGSERKKQWVTELYPNSRYVTAYASRNASEDFAESYAYYLQKPEDLKRLPQKYYFMKNQVFLGFSIPQPSI